METSAMKSVTDWSLSRRRLLTSSGAALAAGALSAAGVPIPASAQSATPVPVAEATPEADVSGLVSIGDRSLYLTCAGSGGPTVVLVTGYRDTSDIWSIDQINPTDPREMVMPSWRSSPASVPTTAPGRQQRWVMRT